MIEKACHTKYFLHCISCKRTEFPFRLHVQISWLTSRHYRKRDRRHCYFGCKRFLFICSGEISKILRIGLLHRTRKLLAHQFLSQWLVKKLWTRIGINASCIWISCLLVFGKIFTFGSLKCEWLWREMWIGWWWLWMMEKGVNYFL